MNNNTATLVYSTGKPAANSQLLELTGQQRANRYQMALANLSLINLRRNYEAALKMQAWQTAGGNPSNNDLATNNRTSRVDYWKLNQIENDLMVDLSYLQYGEADLAKELEVL